MSAPPGAEALTEAVEAAPERDEEGGGVLPGRPVLLDTNVAGEIQLLPLQEGTSRRMVELGERYEIRAQEIYDAQVVATMLEGGIPLLWTANEQDFRRYQEIEVHNPFR